jgi:predicted dehydrogenase
MAEKFRIAFIGVDHPHGAGWRESISLVQDDARIVAFVNAFGNSSASLEEKYAHLPRFNSVDELLKWGGFDGAVVCLPNKETPSVVIKLAREGRAVLVEKPCAATAEEWLPALDAIRAGRVAFQAGYMWRYDEGAQRLKTMMFEGRFGKLISVQMHWYTSDIARRGPGHYLFDPGISGGGFFNWLACHWFDLMMYVTGCKLKSVCARTGVFSDTPSKVEDGGSALLELSNGCLVNFSGGYWLPRWAGESGWSIFGSQRWLHWNPSHPGTGGLFEIHGPQPQFIPMEEKFILPVDNTRGYGGKRTVQLLMDWIAMARGGPDCRNTPESVCATLKALDAIYLSSRLEKTISLS